MSDKVSTKRNWGQVYLCCVLDPQWSCAHCEWKMCRGHWTDGSATYCHNLFSPKCIISLVVADKVSCLMNHDDDTRYVLVLKKEGYNV